MLLRKPALWEVPGETVSCYYWLKESYNQGSPWGARVEGKINVSPHRRYSEKHQGGHGILWGPVVLKILLCDLLKAGSHGRSNRCA